MGDSPAPDFIPSFEHVAKSLKMPKESFEEGQASQGDDDRRIRKNICAVVFSAATIDAALNIWLSYPVYYIEDRRIMHFFADLQKRYTKASIHEKLRVLMANASSVKVRELRRPVEQIFQARNQLVHGSVWFQRVDLIISDSSTLHDRLAMFYENVAFSTDEFARQAIATAEEFLREITVLDAPSSWPDSEDDEPGD